MKTKTRKIITCFLLILCIKYYVQACFDNHVSCFDNHVAHFDNHVAYFNNHVTGRDKGMESCSCL